MVPEWKIVNHVIYFYSNIILKMRAISSYKIIHQHFLTLQHYMLSRKRLFVKLLNI